MSSEIFALTTGQTVIESNVTELPGGGRYVTEKIEAGGGITIASVAFDATGAAMGDISVLVLCPGKPTRQATHPHSPGLGLLVDCPGELFDILTRG